MEPRKRAMGSLLEKSAFRGLENITHFCAGGETPVLKSHAQAVEKFFHDKSNGLAGRERMIDLHGRVKERLAELIRLPASDIAFFLNSSEGVSTALAALDIAAGDNIVVAKGDYNSLALNASVTAKGKGATLRLAGNDMVFCEDEIARATDGNTAAILVSHVSHLTGRRYDLGRLRDIADGCGARLIVDVSHSLGVMSIAGNLCDVLVSCTYKWQLGVHGCGVFAVNSSRWPDMPAHSIGWHAVEMVDDWRNTREFAIKTDAGRFEAGNPPFMALYVLDNGLATLMAHDNNARESHILHLSGHIRSILVDSHVSVLTPESSHERAGNIAFVSEDPMAFVAALRDQNVLVWGGEGRVRISAHIYNDTDDVEAFEAVLGRINRSLLRHQ